MNIPKKQMGGLAIIPTVVSSTCCESYVSVLQNNKINISMTQTEAPMIMPLLKG